MHIALTNQKANIPWFFKILTRSVTCSCVNILDPNSCEFQRDLKGQVFNYRLIFIFEDLVGVDMFYHVT